MAGEKYTLYYWPKEVAGAGRREFVSLVFEEAGVEFDEVNDVALVAKMFKTEFTKQEGFPCLAPPMIVKGNFKLCQAGVITQYLGKEFGLYPETSEDEWHAAQMNATVHDYIAEAQQAFHGKDPTGSYSTQKEETKPYIERFLSNRVPRFLTHFEHALKTNNGGQGFLIGNKLTYVDLGLLHVLRATEAQFPEAWTSLDSIPLLKSYKQRLEARPRLNAYFKSDRCRPFSGDSMM